MASEGAVESDAGGMTSRPEMTSPSAAATVDGLVDRVTALNRSVAESRQRADDDRRRVDAELAELASVSKLCTRRVTVT